MSESDYKNETRRNKATNDRYARRNKFFNNPKTDKSKRVLAMIKAGGEDER